MPRKLENFMFIIVFMLLVFYLLLPERRNVAILYKQKMFLYMNRKNSEVISGRDFKFNKDVFTYGENVVLQPGDAGIAPCSLSYESNVLLFSVKRTVGIGENPLMIVVVNDDTLAKQEIWSEEWMYVKVKAKIGKEKMKMPFVQIICERKNVNKTTQNLVLSKMYNINEH